MFRAVGRSFFLMLILLGVLASGASAQQYLNEEALFRRCYAHLTQLRVPLTDARLAQVKAGTKSALQACQEVFNSALFAANGGTSIQDANDAMAKAVLRTFHELHRSWAYEKGLFNPSDGDTQSGSEPWYEDSPFGSYVTRALFSPSYTTDSVTQGTDYLQPVRVNMTPTPTYAGVPSTTVGSEREFRLGSSHPFAPLGDLLGIRSANIAPIQFFPAVRFADLPSMPDFENIGVPPTASQALTNINFPDVTTVKGPLVETTQFAVRIRGQLNVSTTGNYTLYLNVDDAGSLILDGVRVINRTGVGESSVAKALSAGSHPFTIEFRQRTSTAKLILSWLGPGFAKQVVPASALSGLQADYYTQSQPLPLKFTGNEGGGFLGNHNYLITAFQEIDENYVPNGVLKTNRSLMRALLSDSMCRMIPVVRESDVVQFVNPQSTVPFRQAAACSSCHATIDRGAGVYRNIRWNVLDSMQQDSPFPDLIGILGVKSLAPSMPESVDWPEIPDPEYTKRAAYGHLYFRNFRGELVDREVRSFEDLGSAIRGQDDYYACFAKRYYYYLLGINVELGDPGSSSYPQLNAAETYHRSKVIELANRLKSSKSLSQLIFDIIGSNEYRMSDFGVSFKGPNT